MCEIFILFDGYSKLLDDGKMEANCTCTLIKGSMNVIVDTMTAWDRDKIITALKAHDIHPNDIHYVVCTHSHADHIGNNNLFTNAIHIIGSCIQHHTIFDEINRETGYQLSKSISVIATPGHTHDDVSVIVNTELHGKKKCFAITGDLFEKKEDIDDPSLWKSLGIQELEKKQIENRWAISKMADFIVPGHGPMFEITEKMKNTLEMQFFQ